MLGHRDQPIFLATPQGEKRGYPRMCLGMKENEKSTENCLSLCKNLPEYHSVGILYYLQDGISSQSDTLIPVVGPVTVITTNVK